MSERAARLAAASAESNAAVIAFARECPAAMWTAPCVNDGRTVAAVVRHVGGAYIAHARLMQAVADGEPIPDPFTDWEKINRGNDLAAQRYAAADRDETVASLERNGANLAAAIRVLTDAQLDNAAVVPVFGAVPISTAQLLERFLIPHAGGHLADLRATVPQGR